MNPEHVASIQEALVEFLRVFRACFKRESTFHHLRTYAAGLLSDLRRKSVEPIALAAGVDERTLQWFLSAMVWDHRRAQDLLGRIVANRHDGPDLIGVVDSCGHPKRGDKTPGVQRQGCGQRGKHDNCVVGQHLWVTDNHPTRPLGCMLASDLYLPPGWSEDRPRCRAAGIPDAVGYRPKWRIAVEQLEQALGNGIRLGWVTFDEEYGTVPAFWFELDRLGLRGMGEVQPRFNAWATPPCCCSGRAEHASKRVDHLVTHSPAFTQQSWRPYRIKTTTRGAVVWEFKTAWVQLVAQEDPGHPGHSTPTDRRYWLIAGRNPKTREMKYGSSSLLQIGRSDGRKITDCKTREYRDG